MAILTKDDLMRGFHEMGARRGMALEVHCALSAFGRVDGGADAVIEALIETVGEDGAIVMPSFRISKDLPLDDEDRALGLTVKMRILKENEPRSGMGIVSDTFRARSDVITGDGLFRVSAWGKDADQHARGLHKIIAEKGHALMLGVDIYRLSAMHYVEDAPPDAIKARFAPPAAARARYPENEWLIEGWAPESKPWYTIQAQAMERGWISEYRIGEARCLWMDVKKVTGLYRKALKTDPYGLYGIKGNAGDSVT